MDPKTVPCPKCGAGVREPCRRLSGPYGLGRPLRRMHQERFRAAEGKK